MSDRRSFPPRIREELARVELTSSPPFDSTKRQGQAGLEGVLSRLQRAETSRREIVRFAKDSDPRRRKSFALLPSPSFRSLV